MEHSRVILFLGVFSCLLLITNLICVVFLMIGRLDSGQTGMHHEEDYSEMVSVLDYKKNAKRVLKRSTWLYMDDGATDKLTVKDNEASFSRYRLRPRLLRGVAEADTTTTILGHVVSCPIGISPTATQRLASNAGENATGRAAQAKNVIAAFSSHSNIKMEQIAAASPGGIKWQQCKMFKDREHTLYFVRRAEQAGFSGLVLTVDRSVNGVSYNFANGWITWPDNSPLPNFPDKLKGKELVANPGQDWKELNWLRNQTSLPIIVKGILRGEDAQLAIKAGADAVWVSNHGGRLLDGVPATIDVLSEVVAAVNGSVEVYMDGGIRRGTDVAKAIALGARAVFIGRPVWYGLAHSGQEGVEKILDILKTEFLTTMQLLGADRPDKLDRTNIIMPQSCVGMSCHDSL